MRVIHKTFLAKITDALGFQPANINVDNKVDKVTGYSLVSDAEKSAWDAKGASNLILGDLSTNAYYGDKGKTAYDHSQVSHAPAYTPWPIGSIFISVVSTNPNTLLGYGTWAAFGAGKVMIGLDSGDANFDVVEETGGAKTSTPDAHAGTAVGNHVFTQPSAHDNHIFTQPNAHAAKNTDNGADSSLHPSGSTGTHLAAATHNHNITQYTHSGGAVDAHSAHAGGGVDAHAVTQPTAHAAMSIVQPYIVVYMWKRTA